MVLTISIFLLLAAAGTSLAIWAFLRDRAVASRSGRIIGWLMIATGCWAAFNAIELVAPTLESKLFLANLQYGSIVSLPVIWFRLGERLWKNDEDTFARVRQWDTLFWLIPVVTFTLVWLDPWLGAVRHDFRLAVESGVAHLDKQFGPWFWIHSAYSYVLIAMATVRMILALQPRSGNAAVQAWILVGAALFPTIANLVYLFGIWPLPEVDPTPVAFTATGVLFVLNLSRFRFLSLVPAAQDAVIASLDQGVLIADASNRLIFANTAGMEQLGLTRQDAGLTLDVLGQRLPFLTALATERQVSVGTGEETKTFEVHRAGVLRRGEAVAWTYTFHDITRQLRAQQELEDKIAERTQELQDSNNKITDELQRRRETEKQLFFFSLHDSLTGLPNRSLLLNRLGQAIERLRREPDKPYAVLLIDFDNFKLVNDSYGHAAGDAFLREATSRLLAAVRTVDTVSRLGGDEFVVLLDHVNTNAEAVDVADRIALELSVPIRYGPNAIVPSASVGVLPATVAYTNPEELLRDADLAMYHAKSAGRNRRILFDESMRKAVLERTQITNDLNRAILGGEIELHYQPIVRMGDQAIVGCEALARWNHPVLGRVTPDRFIPLAEETGLIVPLGLFVLMEACRTAALLRSRFPQLDCFIAVNVSALQLAQPNFAEVLVSALERQGLPPSAIHLEITETALVERAEIVQPLLHELIARGFHFKLDDFGTGYSSLAYLHRLPIHTIKVDRSFVLEMTAGILKGIVSLGHELGKQIVAEGIETEEQHALLTSWGCDFGQGYLYGRPMNREAWLKCLTDFCALPPHSPQSH